MPATVVSSLQSPVTCQPTCPGGRPTSTTHARRLLVATLALLALALAPQRSEANGVEWNSTSVSAYSWSIGAAWVGGSVPAWDPTSTFDVVFYSNTANKPTSNLGANDVTVRSLYFYQTDYSGSPVAFPSATTPTSLMNLTINTSDSNTAGGGNARTLTFARSSGYGNIYINNVANNVTIGTGNGSINIVGNNSSGLNIDHRGSGTLTLGSPIVGTGGNLIIASTSGSSSTTVLSAANTYSGDTTISAGTLKLDAGGSIANTPNIIVGAGAGFDVSTLTTALTLGSGQTLKASATGGNTTATITVASSKNLTLGGTTTGLAFTAYGGGATAPLTVAGTGGSLALNSKPVTVTTSSQLAAGKYKLIAKSGSATVTGTPGTLTVNGSGVVSGATPTLQVVSGELYLYVPGISTSGSLTALTTTYGTASTSKSVTVSGTGLTANITATRPNSNFEVSSDNSTWGSTATFTQSGGTASGTLYVRLAATAPVSGTYNSQNTVLSSTGANNVNVATASSGNSVSAATLTITAKADSKTYGQSKTYGSGLAASTYATITGLQNSDAVDTLTITDTDGGGAVGAAAGGTYHLTPGAAHFSTGSSGNYSIGYNTGLLTVSAAALTITAKADSKTYGQSKTYGAGLAASTYATITGLQNGDAIDTLTITDTDGGGAVGAAAGGTYHLTPGAAHFSNGSSGNYSISYNTGLLTVGAATLTITAKADSKTYGQSKTYGAGLAASTYATITGLQNSDAIDTLTITDTDGGGAVGAAAGGTYHLTPSAAHFSTGSAGNYSIGYNAGLLTVSAASTTTASAPGATCYSASGQDVTLNATVTSTAGTVNEGTVTFTVMDGGTPVGTATTSPTVSSGTASVSYGLPAGQAAKDYTIQAVYNTAGNFATSTDGSQSLSIRTPPTASAITPSGAVAINQLGKAYTVTPAVSGSTYAWKTNGTTVLSATGPSITVNFGSTSPYNIEVTETTAEGCTGSPITLSVTVGPNHAPVAQAITMGVTQGDSSGELIIIGGKYAPTDPDGDPLTITAVVLTSPGNGGSVSIVGGTGVVYTASATFHGTDWFDYTVSDSYGGTGTARVTVEVAAAGSGLNIISITKNGEVATIQAAGIPGYTYHLQYITDANNAVWHDVAGSDAQANSTGALTLTDAHATDPQRIYRTKYGATP